MPQLGHVLGGTGSLDCNGLRKTGGRGYTLTLGERSPVKVKYRWGGCLNRWNKG